MTSYSLSLHCPPWSFQSVLTACQFAETAIKAGNKIHCIFLYQDGVLNGDSNIDISSDELNGQQLLQQLHNKYGVKLLLCVTAAEKRGIKPDNLAQGFTIGGLAEFAELTTLSDKVIQFK